MKPEEFLQVTQAFLRLLQQFLEVGWVVALMSLPAEMLCPFGQARRCHGRCPTPQPFLRLIEASTDALEVAKQCGDRLVRVIFGGHQFPADRRERRTVGPPFLGKHRFRIILHRRALLGS